MRKNKALLPVATLSLLLAGCPGNGGASHSGGTVYTGGTGAAGGGPSYSAQDLLDRSNSNDIEGMIELLTADENASSVSGTPGTVEVTFDAPGIGLPEGGQVTLTITVDGEETVYRAGADAEGKVSFDIPAVPTGSSVSVRMDVENAAGVVFRSGTEEKTVTDGDSAFSLTLRSLIDRTLEYTGSSSDQVDVISSGDETIYLTLKDFSLTTGSFSSAFAIRNDYPGTVTTAYVDIQGTVSLTAGNHGGFKLCTTSGVLGGSIHVIFLSSSSGSLEFSAQNTATPSMQIEHMEEGSFTVMDGCTVSGMESGTAAGRSPCTDWDSFISAAQTAGNQSSKFTISKD